MNEDIDRLKSQLLTSGIQTKNNALFQVIDQLIKIVKALRTGLDSVDTIVSGDTNISGDTIIQQFILGSDGNNDGDSTIIPGPIGLTGPIGPAGPSGSGSSSSVPSMDSNYDPEPTIIMINNPSSSSPAVSGYWTLLTDGDVDETDFIFAGGDAISIFVPI